MFNLAFRDTPIALRVYIGSLDVTTSELDVRHAFEHVGVTVGPIEVVMSAATGCSRGFAFTVIARSEQASADEDVLDRMRTATIRGRALTVQRIPMGLYPRLRP